MEPIREFADSGNAVWGTCAGAIVIAQNATDLAGLNPLGLIDVDVRRNAFGRQVDSFHENLSITGIPGPDPFPGIFIRAPGIDRAGDRVEILATASNAGAVAVREGQILATTFHPELTADTRFHKMFVQMATRKHATAL
jgi:5'-phosphate synthase pdxT subunit